MSSKRRNEVKKSTGRVVGQSKGKSEINRNSVRSDVKTIKASQKKSDHRRAAGPQGIINSNIRASDRCFSDVDCKSETKHMGQQVEQDKKTQHHKQKSKGRDIRLEQQLQRQELMRDGVNKRGLQASSTEKIKIGSRYRKLVDTHQINLKEPKVVDVTGSAEIKRQEKQYLQIANQVKITTLQSKVRVDVPSPTLRHDHMLHNLNEEESLVVASPPNLNKQSTVQIHLGSPPEHKQKNEVIKEEFLELQVQKHNDVGQKSVLNMDSDEEKAIDRSVEKEFVKKKESSSNRESDTGQIQLHIFNSQGEPVILTSQETTTNKQQQPISERREKEKKLELFSNHLSYKIGKQVQEVDSSQQKQMLEIQLIQLRRTVRELRLEKVKAHAQVLQYGQKDSRFVKSEVRHQRQRPHTTLIQGLSMDGVSDHLQSASKNTDKSSNSFGRIRKNREISNPSKKEKLSVIPQMEDTKNRPINFYKLNKKKQNKWVPINRNSITIVHKHSSDRSGSREYKTMELQKIVQENMEDSLRYFTPSKSTAFQGDSLKGELITSKMLNKFDSDDKKFHKFLIREQSKSRVKGKRYQEEQKGQMVECESKVVEEKEVTNSFEGTIIKNITKPMYQSEQLSERVNFENSFLSRKMIVLISKVEKKVSIRKQIKFTKMQTPEIPNAPNPSTPTGEIMQLVQKVLPLSYETYGQQQLKGSSLKKYKNCIMFELADNQYFRLVWHYSGKLYLGDWNNTKNQKSGEGLQYIRNKYFYRGRFSSGKRYGKGIMLYTNGSIYEGQFVDGERHGRGKLYDSVNKSCYQGGWVNGKMQGWGYLEFNGDIFQGNFSNGNKDGFGVEHYANGDRYYGQFGQDKFHGEGKYVWADGSYYLGRFKESYRHDFGKWVSADQGQMYMGFYTKDKKRGSGRYLYQNGCIYQGSFDNDFKHGMGMMQYPDGRTVQGVWAQGIFTDPVNHVIETHLEQPLESPKSRTYQTHVRIKVSQVEQQ